MTLLAACAAVAAGCSGTPTGPEVDGRRVARLSRTRFLAFGDSMTSGEVTVPVGSGIINPIAESATPSFKMVVVPSASYPTQLQSLLTARYAVQAAGITVVNAGKALETAQQGVDRLPKALDESQADVVLLLEGVNGLFIAGPDLSAEFVLDMVRSARARARVFVGSMLPTLPGRRNSQVVFDLEKLNSNLRTMAPLEGAVFVDLYNPMLAEAATLIGSDGLHPTEAGYRRIADLFFEAIRNNLEER